jgi:hypothetical protein
MPQQNCSGVIRCCFGTITRSVAFIGSSTSTILSASLGGNRAVDQGPEFFDLKAFC